jgi:hypothetical protein
MDDERPEKPPSISMRRLNTRMDALEMRMVELERPNEALEATILRELLRHWNSVREPMRIRRLTGRYCKRAGSSRLFNLLLDRMEQEKKVIRVITKYEIAWLFLREIYDMLSEISLIRFHETGLTTHLRYRDPKQTNEGAEFAAYIESVKNAESTVKPTQKGRTTDDEPILP